MFITVQELSTGMYAHVINNIIQNDSQIAVQAIEAAQEEVKSYLAVRYNVNLIFSATGNSRNALVMENVKTVAIWNLLRLSSTETLYEVWRERYDRVIEYLKQVADGKTAPNLPLITDANGKTVIKTKFGSNPKFKHDLL